MEGISGNILFWIFVFCLMFVIVFILLRVNKGEKTLKYISVDKQNRLNELISIKGLENDQILRYRDLALVIKRRDKRGYLFKYDKEKKDWIFIRIGTVLNVEIIENNIPIKQFTNIHDYRINIRESTKVEIWNLSIKIECMRKKGKIVIEQIYFFSASSLTYKSELTKVYDEMNKWVEALSIIAMSKKEYSKQKQSFQEEYMKTLIMANKLNLK